MASASTADYSSSTDPEGHTHATGASWGTHTGAATRPALETSTVTLSQLTERVKALCADLKNDRLIK